MKAYGYAALRLGQESPVELLRSVIRASDSSGDATVCFFQRSSPQVGDSETRIVETLVGWAPRKRVSIKAIDCKDHPFAMVSQIVSEYSAPKAPKGLSFKGGAVGYFSYESVRHLEPILKSAAGSFHRYQENIQDAEAAPDADFTIFGNYALFDHVGGTIHLFQLGCDPDESMQKLVLKSRTKPVKKSKSNLKPIPVNQMKSSMGKPEFEANVRKLKKHILAGDIFQAVISERFEFKIRSSALQVFEVLLEMGTSPYLFYYGNGKSALLGASPELLLSCHDGKAQTHPIAGTRPRGKNAKDEKRLERLLLKSPKEQAEHLMLVDLARNDLGRISKPGSVGVTETSKIYKFPGVMHLTSTVVGNLRDDQTSFDALASCFPAGTLSGAPKIRAMQLISELEKIPRGFYGGAFAVASWDGTLEACITIRAMEIRGSLAVLRAGAGVVADSTPKREYEEILHKTSALRKALAIAERKPRGSSHR